jgi:UDP-GlcNAc:undecaprenyl-phosphate GlcNAc-1-phosphate transferase
MSPDRGHVHHRLIDMGLSQKQAVAILYAVSVILGLAAVVITTRGEIRALILVLAFCLAAGIGVFVMKGLGNSGKSQEGKNAQPKKDDQKSETAAKSSEDKDER